MLEKIDDMYQKYLYEKLDLIFELEDTKPEEIKPKEKETIEETKSIPPEITEKYSEYGEVVDFHDGITIIKRNNEYNIVRTNGLLSPLWFDDISMFENGLAKVKINNKYNFINTEGRIISDAWFDEAHEFIDGIALIKIGNQYNYIDRNGKYLSDSWFRKAHDFSEGRAVVNAFYDSRPVVIFSDNVINTKGELLCDEPYAEIKDFKNGFAIVKLKNHYSYINKEGKQIHPCIFDDCDDFRENGLAQVRMDNKYNYINAKGEIISNIWFDRIWYFNGDTAKVQVGNKYNYINTEGKLLSERWFDYTNDFHQGFATIKVNGDDATFDYTKGPQPGFATIKLNGKFNYIDKEGKLLSETWFDYADDFEFRGVGYVIIKGESYFIDKNGNKKKLGPAPSHNYDLPSGSLTSRLTMPGVPRHIRELQTLEDITDEIVRITQVEEPWKINYLNKKTQTLISDKWFQRPSPNEKVLIDYGYIVIIDDYNQEYIMDMHSGSLICKYYPKMKSQFKSNGKFFMFKGNAICKNIDMGDYKVEKTSFGYTCTSPVDSYKVRYQPIKRYGLRYTLCLNKNKVLLYDRISKQYIQEWDCNNIDYDDNFIFDKANGKVYFIYENQIIDVTKYYNEHLKGKEITKINEGVSNILSYDEFIFFEQSKIEKLFEEVAKEREERKRQEEENKRETEFKRAKEEQEKIANDRRQKMKEALEELDNLKKKLKILSADSTDMPRSHIDKDLLLIDAGDHREIDPDYKEVLRYYDLSAVNFDNVKLENIDFSGTNIIISSLHLDPQKVYNRSLKGCNFDKITIGDFIRFKGIDITGCTFSEDNDPLTLPTTEDKLYRVFAGAIYDKTTTFNGIPLTEILTQKEIHTRNK